METFDEPNRTEAAGGIQPGEVGTRTLVQASELLGLSDRQTKRVGSRYGVDGTAGLVHRSRGRAANRQPVARALAGYVDRHGIYRADHEPTPQNC